MNDALLSHFHDAKQASRQSSGLCASSLVTSRFAAFEEQFGATLGKKHRDASQELANFRTQLHDLAGLSTLEAETLSGVSLRNDGLERLAISIGEITTPEDQVTAIEDLLAESDKLPYDQNAHVIAKVTQDLLLRGRSGVEMAVRPRIARCILQAGLKVAPNLLPETLESDNLGLWMHRLVDCATCEFPPDTHRTLAEAGLIDPTDETAKVFRRNVAKRIGAELDRIVAGRARPDELDDILARIIVHGEPMRSRLLTMVVNSARARLSQRNGLRFLTEVLNLVEELSPQHRLTPLEASCNQIRALPNALARTLLPPVCRAIERLSDAHDFRFNRTRRELSACVHQMQEQLASFEFLPGESLSGYEQRTAEQG